MSVDSGVQAAQAARASYLSCFAAPPRLTGVRAACWEPRVPAGRDVPVPSAELAGTGGRMRAEVGARLAVVAFAEPLGGRTARVTRLPQPSWCLALSRGSGSE